MKLSVVISAYNEEKNIEDCLKSIVHFADEIVLVDNSSKDKTVEISKKYKANVFTRPNDAVNLNKNKNYGFSKASGNWVLSLDADERVPQDLQKEIKTVIKSGTKNNAYKIPRKNIIFGKWVSHTGWYPDYQTRLFKKGRAKFPEKHVHELLEVEGEVGTISSAIIHENYKSVFQFIEKLNNYTESEANKLIGEKKEIKWSDAIKFPLEEFCRRFFANEGYKDGLHGLVLSLLMAFYWEVVFAKVWERKEAFKELAPQNLLEETEMEFKKTSKILKYWLNTQKSKENPSRGLYYRLKRKLP